MDRWYRKPCLPHNKDGGVNPWCRVTVLAPDRLRCHFLFRRSVVNEHQIHAGQQLGLAHFRTSPRMSNEHDNQQQIDTLTELDISTHGERGPNSLDHIAHILYTHHYDIFSDPSPIITDGIKHRGLDARLYAYAQSGLLCDFESQISDTTYFRPSLLYLVESIRK